MGSARKTVCFGEKAMRRRIWQLLGWKRIYRRYKIHQLRAKVSFPSVEDPFWIAGVVWRMPLSQPVCGYRIERSLLNIRARFDLREWESLCGGCAFYT